MSAFSTTCTLAQEFPHKPIRIYANQPGGIFDFMARLFAQGATGFLGQTVIVDNRPGNIIPAEIVARRRRMGIHCCRTAWRLRPAR